MTLTGVILICSFVYKLPFNPLASLVNTTSTIYSKPTHFPPTFTAITLFQTTVTSCMDNSNTSILVSLLSSLSPATFSLYGSLSILLKLRLDHTTLMLKTLCGFQSHLATKPLSYQALQGLPPSLISCLLPPSLLTLFWPCGASLHSWNT